MTYMADTKHAAAHRRPRPERGVAAYRRTPEREQTVFYPNHLLYKFPDRLVGGSDSASVSTAAELKFNRNPAIRHREAIQERTYSSSR